MAYDEGGADVAPEDDDINGPEVGDESEADFADEDDGDDGEDGGEDEDEGLTEVQALAAQMGWTPRESWRGRPENWTDAETFLLRQADQAREARAEARRTRQEVEARMSRFEAMQSEILARERADLYAQYNAAMYEAAQDGDQESYVALAAERAQLEQADAAERNAEAETIRIAEAAAKNPLARNFLTEHSYVLEDDEAFDFFWDQLDAAAAQGAPPAAQFQYAAQALRMAYPDMYVEDEAPPPRRGGRGRAVPDEDDEYEARRGRQAREPRYASGSARANTGRDPVSALPPEARRQAQAEVERGLFKSVREYAESYWKHKNGEKVGGW